MSTEAMRDAELTASLETMAPLFAALKRGVPMNTNNLGRVIACANEVADAAARLETALEVAPSDVRTGAFARYRNTLDAELHELVAALGYRLLELAEVSRG